jgi:hypothetical protein
VRAHSITFGKAMRSVWHGEVREASARSLVAALFVAAVLADVKLLYSGFVETPISISD